MKNFLLGICVLTLLSCNKEQKKSNISDSNTYELSGTETVIYHGGPICTMEGEEPEYAEAVVSQNGKIVFVGNYEDAQKKFTDAKDFDLQGKAMFPAFLDGHGHMYNVGVVSLFANILPPPDGPSQNFNAINSAMSQFNNSDDGKWCIKKFGWLVGNGYDDSQLDEKDHPKAVDLDKIRKDIPILIMHQSGHLGVINTKGLELMGWTSANTKDPAEGKLRRNADGTPNGVLEENAFFTVLAKILGKADEEVDQKAIKNGQDQYVKNGYLTAQDGRTLPNQVQALMKAANSGSIFLDVVSYPDMRLDGAYDLMKSDFYSQEHKYKNNLRIGGVKLTLDGSPQGKTAWLTGHYHIPPQGENADYKGYPIMDDAKANTYVEDAFKNKWQILCHTNGDAAIDQYLNAIEKAEAKYNYNDHRTIIIHGQTIRKDQIQKAAKLNVDASLFPMHTFYWGDWHVESVLGHPRADYISPCKDAIMAGLNITSHHDAPVTFPNSMRVLDATVNRVTRSGLILGPDQRLSPFDGLRTLTVWAAHQYFEEATKGTISINKNADFVILDQNPITMKDPLQIHNIKTLACIKRGKTVYQAKK